MKERVLYFVIIEINNEASENYSNHLGTVVGK